MEYEDFLDYLEHIFTTKSFYRFENLILKFLTKYLDDQEKPFTPHYKLSSDYVSNGIAEKGIDELPGPTLIEIKFSKRIYTIKTSLDRIIPIAKESNIKSILLIYSSKITSKERDEIKNSVEKKLGEIILKIWDLTDLSNIMKRNAEYFSSSIPVLSDIAFKNVIEKSSKVDPQEWKKDREKRLKNLKRLFLQNDIVLFTGAGVSKSAKMPDWNELISKLMLLMIEEQLSGDSKVPEREKPIIIDKIQKSNYQSPLIVARYVRAGLSEKLDEKISKLLYEDVRKEGYNTSDLLKAITRLCIPKRGIKAIVNYNFDDLIEIHLKEARVFYRPIYRDVDIASENEIGVYHVHGFLPRNVNDYESISESFLIFSEEAYHQLILDPYSWSNISQLNFLREHTCLMLGLSLTDPNLRRLLDIAAKKSNKIKHYVFLKRLSISDLKLDTKEIQKRDIDIFLNIHHRLQELSFHELGLNIIWYENYSEIPKLLDLIRNV